MPCCAMIAAASVLMIVAASVLGCAGAHFFSRAVFRRATIACYVVFSIMFALLLFDSPMRVMD